MNFGEKLLKLRTDSGMSLDALGKEIGVTKQLLSRLEQGYGMPSAYVLAQLAKKFKVSADYLLGLDKET